LVIRAYGTLFPSLPKLGVYYSKAALFLGFADLLPADHMVLYFLAFPKESTTVVIKTSMGNIPKEKKHAHCVHR
jgi:hypothetical protein